SFHADLPATELAPVAGRRDRGVLPVQRLRPDALRRSHVWRHRGHTGCHAGGGRGRGDLAAPVGHRLHPAQSACKVPMMPALSQNEGVRRHGLPWPGFATSVILLIALVYLPLACYVIAGPALGK